MAKKELSYPYFPQAGGQTEVWEAMGPNNDAKYIGFYGPRGIGKCMFFKDLVELSNGSYKQMGDMSIGDIVLSKNNNGYLEPKVVTGLHRTEEKKQFYKLRTTSGLEINPAETHRLLTDVGWTLAPDLKAGDWLAVARNGVFGTSTLPKPVLRLIALRLKSREKHIPDEILKLDKEHLSCFLKHLYSTDGHFHWDGSKGVIGYSTVSKKLADDIMFCLRKYGINARTQKTVSQRRGKVFGDLYIINIKNKNHVRIFAKEIGAFCDRHKKALGYMLEQYSKQASQSMGADVIPVTLTSKAVGGYKTGSYSASYGLLKSCKGKGNRPSVNRETVQKLALSDRENLQELYDLGHNDIFWDTIESIEKTDIDYGYDIEVADNHNYIANGVISHNSYCMRSNFVTIGMQHKIEMCIVRRTFEDLKENHIIPMRNELKDWFDNKLMKLNMQDKAVTLPNGSRLVFLYCARDSDLDRFQGKAFDIMGVEEAGQFTQHQLTYMLSSNRASPTAIANNTIYPIKALFTFNWGGPGHRWLRKKFHDKEYDTDENPKMYHSIVGRYEDNKIFHKADPDYQRRLRNLPLQLQRAYIDGDPDAFTGVVFNVVDTIHEVDPRDILKEHHMVIPDWWQLYGALDPGTYSPCSFGLYTKTPEGEVYKIFNYYYRDRNPEQHAYSILDAIKGCAYTQGRMPSYVVAGADAFHKQSKRSINAHDVTWKDIFRDVGIHLVPANTSPGSRRAGKAAMLTHLDFSFSYSTQTVTKYPLLRFFKGQCKETLSELRELENAINDNEDIKQGPEVRDHAYDETRYAIMHGVRPMLETSDHQQEQIDPHKDYGRLLSEANKKPLASDVDFQETEYDWSELF